MSIPAISAALGSVIEPSRYFSKAVWTRWVTRTVLVLLLFVMFFFKLSYALEDLLFVLGSHSVNGGEFSRVSFLCLLYQASARY